MIYWFNEARNVKEYRAEKAARYKAEQDKKDEQYDNRYRCKNKDELGFVHKTRADGSKDEYKAYHVGSRNRKNNRLIIGGSSIHTSDDEDIDRLVDAEYVGIRNAKSRRERHEIEDAVNRNMRRHPERWDGDKPVKPKSESTIFDDVEMI